jgi:tRNA(His) 5'-end guanylyltransferase
MSKTDSLGDRMKGYESIPKLFLMKRTPIIIRLDGRAFHSFTKRKTIKETLIDDPFSDLMNHCMVETTRALCNQIQGVKVGYTQSDEISLLLTDWETTETQQWFDGNIQKIVSLSASIATLVFNKVYAEYETIEDYPKLPMFDSRVFNLPKEEVVNYFLWRQQDASRNSVNMLAQYHFSHRELQGKKNNEMQDKLILEKGVNWNDIETWKKRGTCVVKTPVSVVVTPRKVFGKEENEMITNTVSRARWIPDYEIPIFSQDRDYINQYLK